MKTILGIDPGLGHTGWGVITQKDNSLSFVACGVISSNTKESIGERLLTINRVLQNVIESYRPNQCAYRRTGFLTPSSCSFVI